MIVFSAESKTIKPGPVTGKRMGTIDDVFIDAAVDFIERAKYRLERLQPLVYKEAAGHRNAVADIRGVGHTDTEKTSSASAAPCPQSG